VTDSCSIQSNMVTLNEVEVDDLPSSIPMAEIVKVTVRVNSAAEGIASALTLMPR